MVVGHMENHMLWTLEIWEIKCPCISKVACCPEEGLECFFVETGKKNLPTPAVSATCGGFLLLMYSLELPGQIQLHAETSLKLLETLFIHLSAISFWGTIFRHRFPQVLGFVHIPGSSASLSSHLVCFPGCWTFSVSSIIPCYREEFPVTEELTSLRDLSCSSINSLCAWASSSELGTALGWEVEVQEPPCVPVMM